MSSVEENIKNISGKKKGIMITILVLFVLGLCAYVAVRVYYANHWYPNTYFGERELSHKKYEETETMLSDIYADYRLTINGRDECIQTVSKDDIDYRVDLAASLKQVYESQHEEFRILHLFDKKEVSVDLHATYDQNKLNNVLKQSTMCQGSDTFDLIAPENAKVIFSKEKQCFLVQPEVRGNTLDMEKFKKTVNAMLKKGTERLDLRDEKANPDVYKKPQIDSKNETLNKKVAELNRVALRWFVWKINADNQKVIEPDQISKWYTYSNNKMKLNKKAVKKWVEKYCLEFKTMGKKRTFTNHAGKKITVSGGDYGWAFNYEGMVKQLMTALKKEIPSQLQEAYIKDPNKKNKKALTTTKKPSFLGTGFQYDSEHKMNDWDKENFTEVSLSDQKVYVWRKGKVVFKCHTISGKPVPDRQTRKGAYFIKEHQPYRVLKGENYETPVNNWVRIMWTGTGFHAAPWQSWRSWSKTYYRARGSHGCLNLSVPDSLQIYKLTKYKEMVFIY